MSAPSQLWRVLLDLALPALDHVFGAPDAMVPAWSLGGGTAIAIEIDHRMSRDIDLFVPGQPLKLFTPHHNPAARLISPTFQWPGHYVRYERSEGEIDFLSASLQTEPGVWQMPFRNRLIAVDTLEEVIVKKVRFRSARFTARDVFDLAAVAEVRPDLPRVLATEVGDTLPRLRSSVEHVAGRGLDALRAAVIVTATGSTLLPRVFDVARAALDEAARGS